MKPSDRLRDLWLEEYGKYPVGKVNEPPSFETVMDESICPPHTQLRLKMRALCRFLDEQYDLYVPREVMENEKSHAFERGLDRGRAECEECNCEQALALKERVAELEAQQDIVANDLLPAFFKAVDMEIVQPNGGTLADLYETRFILGRLISETGVLSDALYDMTGFDKNADDVIRSQCVKVAACAALILIRRQNDNEDDMEDEPGDE